MKDDQDLLKTLAEFRILSLEQLTEISGLSGPNIRRRSQNMEKRGWIKRRPFRGTDNRGRPKLVATLTKTGAAQAGHTIQDKDEKIGYETHQLLVNDIIIRLHEFLSLGVQLKYAIPGSLSKQRTLPKLHHIPSSGGDQNENRIIPDASIGMTAASVAKTLLFFLEADCGTEPLRSKKPNGNDIFSKVFNYRNYLGLGGYLQYAEWLGVKPKGFRVLFVCENHTRRAQISSLVDSTPQSDFVWVTDYEQIRLHGIGSRIWARGGNESREPESILGSIAAKSS